jgi:hypothetical protein
MQKLINGKQKRRAVCKSMALLLAFKNFRSPAKQKLLISKRKVPGFASQEKLSAIAKKLPT